MRIALSASASDGGTSGISMYMRQMVSWLPSVGTGHQFDLLADEDDLPFLNAGPAVGVVPLSRRLRSPLRNIAWHQVELPALVARRRYDVLFCMAGNRRLPWYLPCATVGTVHDLASLHVAAKYDRWRDLYVRFVLPRLIRRLSHVIAVSASSQADIVRHCAVPPERVSVVPHGVDTERFTASDREGDRARVDALGIRRPYLLYVSRIEHPGKNHAGLLAAFAALREKGAPHQLVLAGADRERAAEVHALAAGLRLGDAVKFLGFVPDEALAPLYRGAEALVFPSLFEGFGLPLIEAMACGVPVLCSDTSSLPEVAGGAALLFDPGSSQSIEQAMARVISDGALRASLVAASLRRAADFSLPSAAQRTLAILEAAHTAPGS